MSCAHTDPPLGVFLCLQWLLLHVHTIQPACRISVQLQSKQSMEALRDQLHPKGSHSQDRTKALPMVLSFAFRSSGCLFSASRVRVVLAAGKARRGLPAVLPHAKGPDSQGKSQGVPIEGSFSFLCLHAAVALTPLLPKAHSLLLTSGTLSPVAPLVAELGLATRPKRQVSSNASPKIGELAGSAKGLGLVPEPQGCMTAAADASGSKSRQADVSDDTKGESEQLIRHHSVQSGSPTGTDAQVDEQAVSSEPSSVQQSAVQQGLPTPALCSGIASQPGSLQHDPQQSHCCQSANQEAAPLHSLESNSCTHQLPLLQASAHPHLQMDPQSELSSSTARKASIVLQQAPVRSQYASLHQGVELVSAPHHQTLPARLLPLTISMAPGGDGRLVKLDSAYERRQDAGDLFSLSEECHVCL